MALVETMMISLVKVCGGKDAADVKMCGDKDAIRCEDVWG